MILDREFPVAIDYIDSRSICSILEVQLYQFEQFEATVSQSTVPSPPLLSYDHDCLEVIREVMGFSPYECPAQLHSSWKGTDGVSTNGVTAIFMIFDRRTFWVLPLIYFYLPKSARAYLFPQSDKNNPYFCSGPISVDAICL